MQARPLTACKQVQVLSKKNLIGREGILLTKSRPRFLLADREKLYDENIELKQKNNSLNDELIKLKTKMFHMENEINRKEDKQEINCEQKPKLLANLKIIIKDLKNQILEKNSELEENKKNMRLSKIKELETEMRVYADECTRLKYHLEEIMKQQNISITPISMEKNIQHSLLLNNLKKENQELATALALADEENNKLQLKLQERELIQKKAKPKKFELIGFKAENKKLRDQLDKVIQESSNTEDKYKREITKLQKDIAELHNNGKAINLTIENYKSTVENLETELTFLRKETINTSKQITKKSIIMKKKQNPPRLLSILHSIISSKKMLIGVLLSLIDKNNIGIIEKEEFLKRLTGYSDNIKKKHIEEIMNMIGHKGSLVSLQKVEHMYEEYDYNSYISSDSENQDSSIVMINKLESDTKENESRKDELYLKSTEIQNSQIYHSNESEINLALLQSKEEVKLLDSNLKSQDINDGNQAEEMQLVISSRISNSILVDPMESLLKHAFFRFQLNRVSKSSIQSILFGNLSSDHRVSASLLESILKSPPLNISDILDQKSFILFFGDNPLVSDIIFKLENSLQDWKILTDDKEKEYDSILCNIITKNFISITEKCQNADHMQSGYISIEIFFRVIHECSIFLETEILRYMELLFYSYENQLNTVPYQHFLKVYNLNSNLAPVEHSFSDKERAKVIRSYLSWIAKALINIKCTASDIFHIDNEGLISKDHFSQGISKLGLNEIDESGIKMIIEAMQDEEASQLSINIREFNSILSHYGVKITDQSNESEEYENNPELSQYSKSGDIYSYSEGSEYSQSYEEESSGSYH